MKSFWTNPTMFWGIGTLMLRTPVAGTDGLVQEMQTAIGIGAGLAAAFGLTRLMSSLLFGVTPLDPATFFLVPLTLAAVAALASYLPARRAVRVDPIETLRYE